MVLKPQRTFFSKNVGPPFIFATQIKIFLIVIRSGSFLTTPLTAKSFKAQKVINVIVEIVHVFLFSHSVSLENASEYKKVKMIWNQ